MVEVLVEVVPPPGASGDLRRRTPEVPEAFDERADDVMSATLDVAQRLRARLDAEGTKLADGTSGWGLGEVAMQFGLTLQAESGVIVAKIGGTASFQVTLTWKKDGGSADGHASHR